MTDRVPLTFAELARTPETRSLAYWIGLLRAEKFADATVSALSFAGDMAYQYDLEDQAGRTGRLFADDVAWRGFCIPLAPVQLTAAWSPLSDAVDRLGPPTFKDVGAKEHGATQGNVAVMLGWDPCAAEAAHRGPSIAHADRDRARFAGLLTVSIARAQEKACGILICAKPGWSHDHGTTFSARTQSIMRKAGFAVTDRRRQE